MLMSSFSYVYWMRPKASADFLKIYIIIYIFK